MAKKGNIMSERAILNKLIQDGEDAKAKLKALEVTYSVGDRLKWDNAEEMLLIRVEGKCCLVNLSTGTSFGNSPIKVNDSHKITQKEFLSMGCGFHRLTRCLDSRKEVALGEDLEKFEVPTVLSGGGFCAKFDDSDIWLSKAYRIR